jgi:DNA replicative helicase MCM subunit Mcm2 (Cdc46/Mcm family)
MNGERVYFSDQNLNTSDAGSMLVEGTNTHFQHTFKNFLKDYTQENMRIYHRNLTIQTQKGKYYLPVELADMKAFEEHLYEKIMASPMEMLKVM